MDILLAKQILNIEPNTVLTEDLIKKAFKEKAKKYHPDAGGDNDYFNNILKAKDILLNSLKEGNKTSNHDRDYHYKITYSDKWYILVLVFLYLFFWKITLPITILGFIGHAIINICTKIYKTFLHIHNRYIIKNKIIIFTYSFIVLCVSLTSVLIYIDTSQEVDDWVELPVKNNDPFAQYVDKEGAAQQVKTPISALITGPQNAKNNKCQGLNVFLFFSKKDLKSGFNFTGKISLNMRPNEQVSETRTWAQINIKNAYKSPGEEFLLICVPYRIKKACLSEDRSRAQPLSWCETKDKEKFLGTVSAKKLCIDPSFGGFCRYETEWEYEPTVTFINNQYVKSTIIDIDKL